MKDEVYRKISKALEEQVKEKQRELRSVGYKEDEQEETVRLYHGTTSEVLNSILRNDLSGDIPSWVFRTHMSVEKKSQAGVVYLTDRYAWQHALYRYSKIVDMMFTTKLSHDKEEFYSPNKTRDSEFLKGFKEDFMKSADTKNEQLLQLLIHSKSYAYNQALFPIVIEVEVPKSKLLPNSFDYNNEYSKDMMVNHINRVIVGEATELEPLPLDEHIERFGSCIHVGNIQAHQIKKVHLLNNPYLYEWFVDEFKKYENDEYTSPYLKEFFDLKEGLIYSVSEENDLMKYIDERLSFELKKEQWTTKDVNLIIYNVGFHIENDLVVGNIKLGRDYFKASNPFSYSNGVLSEFSTIRRLQPIYKKEFNRFLEKIKK